MKQWNSTETGLGESPICGMSSAGGGEGMAMGEETYGAMRGDGWQGQWVERDG